MRIELNVRGLLERTGIVLLAAALLACADQTLAADALLHMEKPSPVVRDVDAMPLIASPNDDAQRRINGAVKRLDESVRKAILECRKEGALQKANDIDWTRNVEVTMSGPRFLSYSINDSAFCGGAHPNTYSMSIVYDLKTGQPVNWTKLLPGSIIGQVALSEGMDGTKMVTLSSPLLHALYLMKYRPRTGEKKDADDDDCREAVASTDLGTPTMMAWLSAKEGGLAVHFELPHSVNACADDVVLPVESLRILGAAPALVDAIATAHAQFESN